MQSPFLRSLIFPWLLALLLVILGPTPVTHAATVSLNVDRFTDPAVASPGVGAAACTAAANDCSLRGAILTANAAVSNDYVINLPTGTYTLTQTGAAEDGDLTGDLDITRDMTIAGAGATATVINGNNVDRVLDILSGNVTISGMTIRGGKAPNGPAGPSLPGGPGGPGENGGGIRNASALTLTNCIVTANNAGAGGPGGTDVMVGVAFPGGAGGAGGGIHSTGALTVISATISSNGAGNGGAGASALPIMPIPSPGASGGNGGDGGGIYNSGTLIIAGAILQSNSAGRGGNGGTGATGLSMPPLPGGSGANGGNGGNGGGVYNGGSLSLARTAMAANMTGNGGLGGAGGTGGSAFAPGLPAMAGGLGGAGGNGGSGSAIYNGAQATMTNSTLSGNIAGNGANGATGGSGGNWSPGPPVAGGPGGAGGNGGNGGSGGIYNGVFATATFTITSSTIASNNAGARGSAGSGGPGGAGMPVGLAGSAGTIGIAGTGGGVAPYSGTLSLKNTVLANNTIPAGGQGPDCFPTVTSQGYDLIRDKTNCTIGGSTTGNITGVNPLLNALADNGGGTLTHALQLSSPARDAGDPAGCKDAAGTLLLVDQRGFARIGGARCDMGAFELQGLFLPLLRR